MDYEKIIKQMIEDQAISQQLAKRYFPELVESDDERIRKEIIKYFKKYQALSLGDYNVQDILAWLEKQCQVKDSSISQHENETCKENGNSLTSEDIRKGLIQYFSTFTLNTFAGIDPKKILSWLEKQGEQKPVDNVEPKFHEEDCNEIETIACHLDNIGNEAMAESLLNIMNKYKSCRPQSTWRPSSEQMEYLWKYAEQNNYDGSILTSLYQELKKLK